MELRDEARRLRAFPAVVLALHLALAGGLALTLPSGVVGTEVAVLGQASAIRDGAPAAGPRSRRAMPLYPGLLALVDAALPAGLGVPPDEGWRLPYERAVRLESEGGTQPGLWRLRAIGVLIGLGATVALLGGVGPMVGTRGRTAVLAGASLAVLPGWAIVFATPSHVLAIVALGTIGTALAARGAATTARGALVGLPLGLAWLAGPQAAAPSVAALVLLLLADARAPRRPVLAAGLLVLAGAVAWYVLAGVTPGAEGLDAATDLGALRGVPPDVGEAAAWLGSTALASFAGVLGDGAVHAGALWVVPAMGLLPLCCLLALAAVASRRATTRERACGAALLAGVVVGTAAALFELGRTLAPDPRGSLALALPAAGALAAGWRVVLGGMARVALGVLCVFAAAGGPLLLHAGVLPAHHPPLEAGDVRGCVTYLDLGARTAGDAVRAGEPLPHRGPGWPDADDTMVVGPAGAEPGIVVDLGRARAEAMHLLSVRFAPPLPGYRVEALTHVELWAGERRLSGLLSSHGRRGAWCHLALPAVPAGRPFPPLSVRGEGGLLGLSQAAVRRLPFAVGPPWTTAGRLRVPVRGREGCPGGAFRAHLVAAGVRASDDLPLRDPGPDVLTLDFALPPRGAGGLGLGVELPGVVLADVKVLYALSPEGLASGRTSTADVQGRTGSPGLLTLALDPERHADLEVVALSERHLPPGVTRLAFLDGDGRPAPDGTLVWRSPRGDVPVSGGGLEFDGPWPGGLLRVVYTGTLPLDLDRVVARGPQRWVHPLGLVR